MPPESVLMPEFIALLVRPPARPPHPPTPRSLTHTLVPPRRWGVRVAQNELGLSGSRREQMMAMPADRKWNLLQQHKVRVGTAAAHPPIHRPTQHCGRPPVRLPARPSTAAAHPAIHRPTQLPQAHP